MPVGGPQWRINITARGHRAGFCSGARAADGGGARADTSAGQGLRGPPQAASPAPSVQGCAHTEQRGLENGFWSGCPSSAQQIRPRHEHTQCCQHCGLLPLTLPRGLKAECPGGGEQPSYTNIPVLPGVPEGTDSRRTAARLSLGAGHTHGLRSGQADARGRCPPRLPTARRGHEFLLQSSGKLGRGKSHTLAGAGRKQPLFLSRGARRKQTLHSRPCGPHRLTGECGLQDKPSSTLPSTRGHPQQEASYRDEHGGLGGIERFPRASSWGPAAAAQETKVSPQPGLGSRHPMPTRSGTDHSSFRPWGRRLCSLRVARPVLSGGQHSPCSGRAPSQQERRGAHIPPIPQC